jgi:hypothetical protein
MLRLGGDRSTSRIFCSALRKTWWIGASRDNSQLQLFWNWIVPLMDDYIFKRHGISLDYSHKVGTVRHEGH